MTTLLATIGERLGLFKNLAEHGSATSKDFALRRGLNQRYLREWLGGMAAAGYLNYDVPTKRFSLRVEHASVLAQVEISLGRRKTHRRQQFVRKSVIPLAIAVFDHRCDQKLQWQHRKCGRVQAALEASRSKGTTACLAAIALGKAGAKDARRPEGDDYSSKSLEVGPKE